MTPFSFSGVGGYISIIEIGLNLFGLTPPDGSVAAAVNGVISIIALIIWFVGQLNRPDLHLGLFRKG